MGRSDVLQVDLLLDTPDELFVSRIVNPMTEDYPPRGDVSGVEHAINVFYAEPKYGSIEIYVSLPEAEVAPDTADRMSAAVSRWCRARLIDVDEEIHASRWRGRQALLFAFLALFFFTGLSKILGRYNDSLVLEILSEGFNIAGWVALWVPIEILMFDVWRHRLDRRAYVLLSDARIQLTGGAQ